MKHLDFVCNFNKNFFLLFSYRISSSFSVFSFITIDLRYPLGFWGKGIKRLRRSTQVVGKSGRRNHYLGQ